MTLNTQQANFFNTLNTKQNENGNINNFNKNIKKQACNSMAIHIPTLENSSENIIMQT